MDCFGARILNQMTEDSIKNARLTSGGNKQNGVEKFENEFDCTYRNYLPKSSLHKGMYICQKRSYARIMQILWDCNIYVF